MASAASAISASTSRRSTERSRSDPVRAATHSTSTDAGWLNAGRIFSEPTGDAINRVDLLQVAMHGIGHALGLDYDYSGFNLQLPGTTGPLKVTPLRPYAGIDIFVNQGPHIRGKSLMSPNAEPGERRLISAVDALLMAQVSLLNRPDLSEPHWIRTDMAWAFRR